MIVVILTIIALFTIITIIAIVITLIVVVITRYGELGRRVRRQQRAVCGVEGRGRLQRSRGGIHAAAVPAELRRMQRRQRCGGAACRCRWLGSG